MKRKVPSLLTHILAAAQELGISSAAMAIMESFIQARAPCYTLLGPCLLTCFCRDASPNLNCSPASASCRPLQHEMGPSLRFASGTMIRTLTPGWQGFLGAQDMFERIAGEAAQIMRMHGKRTMTAQVPCQIGLL
jgi:hypothetical protein